MVIGYDEERPKAEEYALVEKRLKRRLRKSGIEGLSLMLYGSYARGDYTPGLSDMDGIMIFPDDVVLDKNIFYDTAGIVCGAMHGTNVRLDITPTDLAIMRDGRFNSYAPPFARAFAKDGKVIVGPDYRNEISFELPDKIYQNEVREVLRKTRENFLMSVYSMKRNYTGFVDNFQKSLNGISNCSRRMAHMVDGKDREGRFEAVEFLSEVFPEFHYGPLKWIEFLFEKPSELDTVYNDPKGIKRIWGNSLTALEEMIKGYIKMFPKKTQLEHSQHWEI